MVVVAAVESEISRIKIATQNALLCLGIKLL